VVALALAAFVRLISVGGVADATTFNPQFSSPVSFSDTAPGGHPDVRVGFDIPPPSALGGAVNFSDPALVTATDAQVPTGAYIGQVSSIAQLGLFNDGCMTNVPATFDLVEASTPATSAVTISGSAGNLAEDDGDLDEDGIVDQPAFANNGIADGADAYPAFLLDLLDPDGPGPATPVVPAARYFGVDIVFNISIVPVQVVVLAPGDLAAFPNQGWMTAAWGTPSLIVLGNPLDPPSNTGITDFCNLTSNSTILGITHDNACTPAAGAPSGCTATGAGFSVRKGVDGGCPGSTTPNECGFVRATNPATSRTLKTRVYAVSERDYDNDGIANSLDVCFAQPNSGWDPRASNFSSGGDSDADGLPNACDPSAFPNADEDGDGWQNRIDNCPTTPNAGQEDDDVPRGTAVNDGGSRTDGIGDACDVPANSCVDPFPACGPLTPTGANGHYHATVIVSNVCIGLAGSDSDADGVCNVDEPPANKCAGGLEDDDCDNDGVGDRLDNCIAGVNPPAAGFAQSQRDLNADGFADGTDITILAGSFGKLGGDPSRPAGYQGRFDLNNTGNGPDSVNDGTDITLLAGTFGKPC